MGRKEQQTVKARPHTNGIWFYRCKACGKPYIRSTFDAKNPNVLHQRCYRRKCSVCDAIFATEEENKEHCRIDHPDEYRYFCFDCNECFPDYIDMGYYKKLIDDRYQAHCVNFHADRVDPMMLAISRINELYEKYMLQQSTPLDPDATITSKINTDFLQWIITGDVPWKKLNKNPEKHEFIRIDFEISNGKKWEVIHHLMLCNNKIYEFDGQTMHVTDILELTNMMCIDWNNIASGHQWDILLKGRCDMGSIMDSVKDASKTLCRANFYTPKRVPKNFDDHLFELLA